VKKKILYILPWLNTGGAEKLVVDYALNFDSEAYEVMVLSVFGRHETIFEKKLEEKGIRLISINHQKWRGESRLSPLVRIYQKIYIALKVKHIVEEIKPDIIHSHLHVTQFLLGINPQRLQAKLFHTIHSHPDIIDRGLNKWASRRCYRKKGMVPIVLHKGMIQEVRNYYGIHTVLVVKNGIDLESFRRAKDRRAENRKALGFDEGEMIIGHIGRFKVEKNHAMIVEIFHEVSKANPKARLVLIGEGELKGEIEARVKELEIDGQVIFLGGREDVPEILSTFDVFLFPSLYEALGIALVEAQAAGVPCVVSRAIPKEAYLTPHIISLPIGVSLKDWRDAVLGEIESGEVCDSLESYDIHEVVRHLEKIYFGK
jgi:glycosyltransferase involved in cell wall biosynthesis